jgi:hypothetical protein
MADPLQVSRNARLPTATPMDLNAITGVHCDSNDAHIQPRSKERMMLSQSISIQVLGTQSTL